MNMTIVACGHMTCGGTDVNNVKFQCDAHPWMCEVFSRLCWSGLGQCHSVSMFLRFPSKGRNHWRE